MARIAGMCLYFLILNSCAAPLKQGPRNSAQNGYMLPSARPSDEIKRFLEEQLPVQAANAVYHRDLGTLYQSRVRLVAPARRFELVRLANKHLDQANRLRPNDPQTLIFLGMARASRGKDPEVNLLSRMTSVLEGFALMDQAVALEPNNFSLHLLRAKAGILAPTMLGRTRLLQVDYRYLQKYLAEPESLPIHLRALGLIFMGDYQQLKGKPEDAPQFWRKAAALDTTYKHEASKRLKGNNPTF